MPVIRYHAVQPVAVPGVTLPTDLGAIAMLAVAFLVGIAAFGYALTELWTAYRMYATETNTVASVANRPGTVEIEGTVRPVGDPLTAPFTDAECVVYEYTIEALRRDHDDGGTDWETIDSGGERVPFRIEDDTGSVLVEPAGADLRLDAQRVFRARPGEKPPSGVARFLSSVEIGGFTVNGGEDRRYTERRLDSGERVYVLGPARHDPSVSEAAGEVNAVIGRTSERGFIGRLADRVLGHSPFLLADGGEGAARSRLLKNALFALVFGAIWVAVFGSIYFR